MSIFRDFQRSYHDFRKGSEGIVVHGPRLVDRSGLRLGYFERMTRSPERIRIEGWVDADRVALHHEDGQEVASTPPRIPRLDVQRSLQSKKDKFGFSLAATDLGRNLLITVMREGVETSVSIPRPGPLTRLRGELALNRRYLRVLLSVVPELGRWVLARDPGARRRIGSAFRSAGREAAPTLDTAALTAQSWPDTPDAPITIVMPVYEGLHLLDPVIGRVHDHSDLPWHLVVVDDASPDPAVGERLRWWQEKPTPARMTLVTNRSNQGFVGSANAGLKIAIERGHDVVLLNSDALVSANWCSRLLKPMRTQERVASVTPFSNDAEICNIPFICKPSVLEPGDGDETDRLAAGMENQAAVADAPTGVGFCMAVNITVLRQIPVLDKAFGRGYGEEVDWCQKAAKLGWRHLLNAGMFVEHHGGQSLGSEAKQRLMQRNGALISRRYPSFDRQVQDFISSDPLRVQRLALGIALAARRAHGRGVRLRVFLGHGLGGGAEIYLRQRVETATRTAGHAVVIRAMPDTTWRLELHGEMGVSSGSVADLKALVPMFRHVEGLQVVYSCGVGAARPRQIPWALNQIARRPHSRLEVTFNDFFPVSPSYTLVNSEGVFSGLPLDPADPAHQCVEPDGCIIPLDEWQRSWGALLEGADQLTVFSRNSAGIAASVWPQYRDRIVVRPHRLPIPVPLLQAAHTDDEVVIGVMGSLNGPKGAAVLAELSQALAASGKGRLVLVGNL